MYKLALAAIVLASGISLSAPAAEFFGGVSFGSGGYRGGSSYRDSSYSRGGYYGGSRYVRPQVCYSAPVYYRAPRYYSAPVTYYVEPREYAEPRYEYTSYDRSYGYSDGYYRSRYSCR